MTKRTDSNPDPAREAVHPPTGPGILASDPKPGARPEEFGGSAETAANTTPMPSGLREDGPTLEEFMRHGEDAESYPPRGYAERSSQGLKRYRATGKAPVLVSDDATALVVRTTSTPHFNRGDFRFTKKPTLIRRADVSAERWEAIVAENGRYLTVEALTETDVDLWIEENGPASPGTSDLDRLRAENKRLRDELDTARKDLSLTKGRRDAPARGR